MKIFVRLSFHYNKTRLFYRIESGFNWSHSQQQKLLILTSPELALRGVYLHAPGLAVSMQKRV